MSNFVFYDFETSSSNKYWGQIIQIGAVLTNDNLDELDRFDARCRLSPGIIPEAMALIVNKTSPSMLKKSNLSHYEMIRQFVEKLKSNRKCKLINKAASAISGKMTFIEIDSSGSDSQLSGLEKYYPDSGLVEEALRTKAEDLQEVEKWVDTGFGRKKRKVKVDMGTYDD